LLLAPPMPEPAVKQNGSGAVDRRALLFGRG
jgi:hypothetical protein